MSNPFTQDHHGLTKEAYNPAVRDATSDYSPSYVPPAPEPSEPQQYITQGLTGQIGRMAAHAGANNWNTQLNSMNSWEKLRFIFSHLMGKLGGVFKNLGFENNLGRYAREQRRLTDIKTLEQMTGSTIAPEEYDKLFGDVDSYKPETLTEGLTNPDNPLYQRFQPQIEATRSAAKAYTTQQGNELRDGVFSWVPSKTFDQGRAYKELKSNPEYQKTFNEGAFNPYTEQSVYSHTPTDQQLLISPEFAKDYFAEDRTVVKPEGVLGGLMDGHRYKPEFEPLQEPKG